MARLAVTALEKSQGLAAAAKYLQGFDEDGQLRMLEALAITKSDDLAGIANLLHRYPNTGDYRLIKALFWARWDSNVKRRTVDMEEVTAEEILSHVKPEKQLEARLAMVTHGKGLPMVEGLSKAEVLRVTAEAYLAAPIYSGENDFGLSQWLSESGEGMDLDDVIRQRIEKWGEYRGFTSDIPAANQALLALHLKDEDEGRALARKYYRVFLKGHPGYVAHFLKEVTLPDDLRAEFEKLQREAE